jgi:hypothetical protein
MPVKCNQNRSARAPARLTVARFAALAFAAYLACVEICLCRMEGGPMADQTREARIYTVAVGILMTCLLLFGFVQLLGFKM